MRQCSIRLRGCSDLFFGLRADCFSIRRPEVTRPHLFQASAEPTVGPATLLELVAASRVLFEHWLQLSG
jgi:hypothetical protein